MNMRVCIFGSSSDRTNPAYKKEAEKTGRLLAERGHEVIFGGGRHGCMGACSKGVMENGGSITGVIHEMWVVDGEDDHRMSKRIVVGGDSLADRKRGLLENAEALFVLPGGPGTWDELWEVITERQIGFSRMPIVLLNVDGFYDGSIDQLQVAYEQGITYLPPEDLLHVETEVEAALDWLEAEVLKNREEEAEEEATGKSRRRGLMRKRDFSLHHLFHVAVSNFHLPSMLFGLGVSIFSLFVFLTSSRKGRAVIYAFRNF
jgi:hypothetical protein